MSEQEKNQTNVEGEQAQTTEEVKKEEPKKEEVDWKSKYFYMAAEMENLRKRYDREKENIVKYGSEKILGDIVDGVDHFERTLDMLKFDEDQKVKNIVIGLEMLKKLFADALGKHGLTQLESVGKDFDPNFHEAVGQEYKEGTKPNVIIKEFQRGYVLNGRLLRASKVIVSNDKQ